MANSSLTGKHALVAGGSVGAFPAIKGLVDAGADVVLQGQTPDEIEAARKTAAELGEAVKVAMGPVATFADAEAIVEKLVDERGSIDVLLTPVVPQASPSVTTLSEANWADFKSSYITRAVALTRAATAKMTGQPEGGRVVVFGSATTFLSPGVAQAAANAAMLSLTSAASAGLRDTSVRVNGVLLGVPGADQGGVPAPGGDVDVLGPAVAWLAGPASAGVNGKFVYVGGSDIGFYTMPMLMENANVQVRFAGDSAPSADTIAEFLNNLTEIGKVQRQA